MRGFFDVHNAEFVGVDCLTAGTQYCVVRKVFFQIIELGKCV